DGDEVYLIGAKRPHRVQSVQMSMEIQRDIVGALPAGNIPALLGLDARSGETLATIKDVAPFESIHYVSEPVVTIAVEPKHPRDLPKLVEGMRRLNIEDPNLIVTINEETGETLMARMGLRRGAVRRCGRRAREHDDGDDERRPVPSGVDGLNPLRLRGHNEERAARLRVLQRNQVHSDQLRPARGPRSPHLRPTDAR